MSLSYKALRFSKAATINNNPPP